MLGLLRGLTEPSAGAASSGRGPAGGPARIAGELVKDPVCATYIPRESAIAARVAGETRYYCSVTLPRQGRRRPATPSRTCGRAAHG